MQVLYWTTYQVVHCSQTKKRDVRVRGILPFFPPTDTSRLQDTQVKVNHVRIQHYSVNHMNNSVLVLMETCTLAHSQIISVQLYYNYKY